MTNTFDPADYLVPPSSRTREVIHLYVSGTTKDSLRKMAEKNGVTVAALGRAMLDHCLRDAGYETRSFRAAKPRKK